MPESLVLSGLGELIRASQVDPDAEQGFFLADFDSGEPTAVTSAVEQLLLDGSVVSGLRSDDRTVALSINVFGDNDFRASITSLVAAIVDDQLRSGFTLTWTPSSGREVVFDCKRGSVSAVPWLSGGATAGTQLTVSFPAQPFTRPASAVVVSPGASTQLFSFDSTAGLSVTGASLSSSTDRVEGSASVALTPTSAGSGRQSLVAESSPSAVSDMSGFIAATVCAKDTAPSSVAALGATYSDLRLVLTDTHGVSTSFPLAGNNNLGVSGRWVTFSASLTNPFGLDLSSVASWRIEATYAADDAAPGDLLLDDLELVGNAGATSGKVTLPTVGAYRAPLRLDLTFPDGAAGGVLVHAAPGAPSGYDPNTTSGLRARAFRGGHQVIGVINPANLPASGDYTVQVTFTQGADQIEVVRTIPASVIAAEGAGDTGNLVVLGPVTLPVIAVDDDSTETIAVTIADNGDPAQACTNVLVCRTDYATTVLTAGTSSGPMTIDVPDAYGVVPPVMVDGRAIVRRGSGAFFAYPGGTPLYIYTPGGTYTLQATYYPRFLAERYAVGEET